MVYPSVLPAQYAAAAVEASDDLVLTLFRGDKLTCAILSLDLQIKCLRKMKTFTSFGTI